MRNVGYYISFFFLILPTLGFSFDKDQLENDLVEKGFENVAVVLEKRHLMVTYENRIYRDEIRAVKAVTSLLLPHVEDIETVTLIPQHRKIPLLAITIPAENFRSVSNGDKPLPIEVSLDVDAAWRKIGATPRTNSSVFKFDIIVHPQFIASFGDFEEPVKSQINLAPELETTLWKGASLSAQLIIPLQNELGDDGDELRPRLLTFNQTVRFPRQVFASTTVGYFTRNRYGVDFDVKKHFANGRWSLGANIGYTSFAEFVGGAWYYSRIGYLTTLLNAEYRVPEFDLSFRAMYGRFLFRDSGVRFDVSRQFGEVDIGFFALQTGEGSNVGFNFSVPIFPPKYLKPGRIRVSPARSFSWGYRYKGLPQGGRRYSTGNRLEGFMKRLQPDYVKNRMVAEED
jgi:hypothetical protein